MAHADIPPSVWINPNHPSPAKRPPISDVGVVGWLRANLFSSIGNTLLTLLTLLALYFLLTSLARWLFTTAYWEPIWLNRKLFAVGIYPQANLLQPCLLLATVSTLLGLSAGRWGSLLRNVAAGLAALLFVFTVAPVGPAAQIWLGFSLLLVVAGFVVGLRLPIPSRWLAISWLLVIPFSFFVLRGVIDLRFLNIFGFIQRLAVDPQSLIINIPFFGAPVPSGAIGGLLLTVLLTVVGITFSFPIGVALALGRRSKLPVVRYFCIGYIELIRGVPLITLLFLSMLILPLFLPRDWPNPENISRAMVAITLFSAAYLAENVRGGLQAVPRGQYEAADALGLGAWQRTRLIILPQALRAVIPAIVGQFIALFKDTSLVTLVGLMDLLGIGRAVIQQPEWLAVAGGITREVYVFVAVVYFIFSFGMSWVSRRLEERLGRGHQ